MGPLDVGREADPNAQNGVLPSVKPEPSKARTG